MAIHELKTTPMYFHAILRRDKTFEVRKNDRDFKLGDILELKEYDMGRYTGAIIRAYVPYIMLDPEFVKPGYVVMSLELVTINGKDINILPPPPPRFYDRSGDLPLTVKESPDVDVLPEELRRKYRK